jgi:hypothetical protein
MYTSETLTDARAAARAELVRGFIWVLAGGLVSGVTYLSADTGGSFFVFWGAMAYGGFRILRAGYYWFNPKAFSDKA